MSFETIDEILEEKLLELIESTGEAPAIRTEWDSTTDELINLGLIDGLKSHQYKSGGGLVYLTFAGKSYFRHKKKWGAEQNEKQKAETKGLANRAASVAGSFIGAATKEYI